ncbi:hypothetical protein MC52_016770 [Klebsiella michiganensis]|nr:hypothetical protein C2U44_22640 [Klebsiella oxytoca]MBZ7269337.1 hypothetical protein [Klebsiella michiganensis]PNO44090.1 hypothetical protein MC52_016770 [Klebsiella michiganensis]POT84639.1 hypothetical protein C3417_25330 [Klebsiella oxytoca]POV47980.1 hypothetical protein C3409_27125 [Klebsiella oxytoca]
MREPITHRITPRVTVSIRPFSPVALRLPGLRVSSRLRGGSPGKAFTPRPGISGLQGQYRLAAKFARTDNAQNHAQRHGQHQWADGFVQQRG